MLSTIQKPEKPTKNKDLIQKGRKKNDKIKQPKRWDCCGRPNGLPATTKALEYEAPSLIIAQHNHTDKTKGNQVKPLFHT